MIALRSVFFNTIFYVNLIVRMIVLSPYYFYRAAQGRLPHTEELGAVEPLVDGEDRRHDLRDRGHGEPA